MCVYLGVFLLLHIQWCGCFNIVHMYADGYRSIIDMLCVCNNNTLTYYDSCISFIFFNTRVMHMLYRLDWSGIVDKKLIRFF